MSDTGYWCWQCTLMFGPVGAHMHRERTGHVVDAATVSPRAGAVVVEDEIHG